jgi:hypothetical protein
MVAPAAAQAGDAALKQETPSMRVAFNARQPGLSVLSFDSLERGSFHPSPIVDPGASPIPYTVSAHDGWIRYALSSDPAHAVWEMRCDGNTLRMRSFFRPDGASRDVTWRFNPDVTPVTLLGRVTPEGDVVVPAVLHLPGMGSLRIYAKGSASAVLRYDAARSETLRFVDVTFPAATAERTLLEYTLQATAIFPAVPGIDPGDLRYDGFRRDWMDVFQQQARLHVLANNAASDPCAFVLYFYSDMARYTPPLVEGLTALDLVRQSLDRVLAGFIPYGIPGYNDPNNPGRVDPRVHYVNLDSYPSLLISAYDYVDGSGDQRWLSKNYQGLRKWAEIMTAANADGSPLLEFPASGNYGSWGNPFKVRPANWWDATGFGHQDAYSNALGYRALRGMAALADRMGQTADAASYRKRAGQIRSVYAATFLDPSTGVLAGWKSSDGQLHDYYFPFVNGIAVRYGLLDPGQARQVMDRIVAKMDSVGYSDFALGLPGNLVPIRRGDYVDLDPRWGGPQREDGTDTFQVYQNGGVSACFAYFTMAALYQLGEKDQGDRILMPMLDGFARQGFTGRAPDGMSYDWRDWKGGAHGYEGLLVDNYYTLLTVLDRANMIQKMP